MREGMVECLPILLAVIPFSAVFGALAVEKGLSFGQMILASFTIYACASQYAMIDLMGQGVPAWSIVLTVFAINFRHVLYSASLGRRLHAFSGLHKALAFFLLTDPQFATSELRASQQDLRPAYYFGFASVLFTTWMAGNAIGGVFGSLLESPEWYGLDFILPLYFTGLIVGFRRRPRFIVVLSSSAIIAIAAYFTLGSPWHIAMGGAAGLMVAALMSKPGEASFG